MSDVYGERNQLKPLFILLALVLSACSTVTEVAPNEGIVQVSGNVYEYFKTDYRGIFGSEESLINGVVTEADDFAKKQSMVAIPVSARVHRVGILADWAWFYYKFALVDINSPQANKKLGRSEIERDARLAPEFYVQRHKQDRSSAYDQINKLNDLRIRGVISDAEFEKEKSKLLD